MERLPVRILRDKVSLIPISFNNAINHDRGASWDF